MESEPASKRNTTSANGSEFDERKTPDMIAKRRNMARPPDKM
jgi:hypothetical protein